MRRRGREEEKEDIHFFHCIDLERGGLEVGGIHFIQLHSFGERRGLEVENIYSGIVHLFRDSRGWRWRAFNSIAFIWRWGSVEVEGIHFI